MTQQPEYFGGTPTSQAGYRPPKPKSQSVVSSIWKDFIDNSPIDDAVRGGISAMGAVAGAIDKYAFGNANTTQDFATGISALNANARAAAAGMSDEARKAQQDALVEESKARLAQRSGIGTAGPLALTAAATEAAWSYGVARPAATGALLADPNSPLYKTGTVEQLGPNGETEIVPTEAGFQPGFDLRQAWNRSEDVSFGQAVIGNSLVQSDALPAINPAGVIVRLGGLDQYDPWSVSDMADAQDNPFYVFATGSADAGLQFAGPAAFKVARLSAMERLGLRTTVQGAEDLAAYRSDWQRYAAGDRANNFYGDYVQNLADAKNLGEIRRNPLVANLHGIDKGKMARLLQETTDPNTVNELMLAARGDLDALRSLQAAAPDHVWALSDMNDSLRQFWYRGEQFRPDGADAERVAQIFDSAIDRDAYFSEVRRMFTSEDGLPRTADAWMPTRYNEQQGGIVWNPLANWLSKKTTTVVEKTRQAGKKAAYVISESDFEGMPQWLHEASKSTYGQPVTRFMHWVGSRQPLGTVSRSGLRPDDLWIELKANMDQVPLFRGTKPLLVDRKIAADGTFQDVYMTPAQYSAVLRQRVSDGIGTGSLQPAWQAVEDDMVRVMALNLGVDADRLRGVVAGYRSAMDESYSYMANNKRGYLWDEQAQFIRLSPDSRRALLDAFPTLPIGELYTGLQSELGTAIRTSMLADDFAEQLFDVGSKYFRTNVLFRFGYIPKNSIAEPTIASALAHGTVLASEGLGATMKNVASNAAARSKRAAYALQLDRLAAKLSGKDVPASARQLAKEKRELVRQHIQILEDIENMKALHESVMAGRYGPTISSEYSDELTGYLSDAQVLLNNIEDALDGRMPEWRQIVPPANLTDLNVRLRELRAVTGQDDAYVGVLRQELKDIEDAARDRAKATGSRARLQGQADSLQKQIDTIDNQLLKLDQRDGGIGAGAAQSARLMEQRDALLERRDSVLKQIDGPFDDDVADFTPNEAARKAHIEATLARIDARTVTGSDGSKIATDPKIVEKIQRLQNLYDSIVESYDTPVIDYSKRLDELDAQLKSVEAALRKVQVQQGEVVAKRQSVRGLRAYRGSGDGYTYIWVGDQRIAVPAAFSDRAYDFGSGYRAEASAAMTSMQTFDPSYFASHNMLRWKLSGGPRRVTPQMDTYWDELEHVSNRIFRSEPLIQRILQAKPGMERQAAVEFLVSPEGQRYQKSMGKEYLKKRETRASGRPLANVDSTAERGVASVLMDSTTQLDDVIRLVQQYLPDQRVRDIVATREVSSGELQRWLGGRADLKDVVGNELVYDPSAAKKVTAGVNAALERVWKFMSADIEDRVARWPFFEREFQYQLQRRANVLKSQGMTMTATEANALRQGAARAALVELEKTFYNIRRYSTPVYASRFLLSFPGAFFNSFYRYGRFAAKQPERTFIASQLYGNMLENMGVDEQGNPTGTDLRKAKYLVIPGTRKNVGDAGIRIPVASFEGLAIGAPGLSWLATMAVSAAVANNPTQEEMLKQALGPTFDEVFPYGITRDPRSVLLGAYQKELLGAAASVDGLKGITGALGVSDEKFITTATQIYADSMARWERDGSDPRTAPTYEQALAEARAFILTTGAIKFVNPLTTNRPVPGQLMRDEWYATRAAFPPEREEEARAYFLQKYGDWARWYTQSGSKKTAYIPATQEAYKRVYVEYPDLASKLYALDVQNPSMVNLLTIGTGGEFSEAVSNFLRGNPLPGDDNTVYSRMTPEQFANQVRIDDGYTWYDENKTKYDAERARLSTLRDNANTAAEKDYYRKWIASTDAAWKSAVKDYSRTNDPWAVQRTGGGSDRAEKAALYLTTILRDRKFRAGPGKAQVWQNIDQFLTDRDAAKAQLAAAKSADEKQQIKAAFYEYVQGQLIADDPDFGGVFNRYFSSEWVDE